MNNDSYGLDYFRGTAAFYSKYRLDYSEEMIKLLVDEFNLNGQGRLLDIGCGTGKISIPLHKYFTEVIGIDISLDMLEEAKTLSRNQKIKNIMWVQGKAEGIDYNFGKFKLITCGDAFHWMKREIVVNHCYDLLSDDSGFVILGAGGNIGSEKYEWQKVIWQVIKKWLGDERRNSHWVSRMKQKTHEEVLRELPFKSIKSGKLRYKIIRDIDSIIGYLYSTSFCNKGLFGENVGKFEIEMRETLKSINPTGLFEEEVESYYIFAFK